MLRSKNVAYCIPYSLDDLKCVWLFYLSWDHSAYITCCISECFVYPLSRVQMSVRVLLSNLSTLCILIFRSMDCKYVNIRHRSCTPFRHPNHSVKVVHCNSRIFSANTWHSVGAVHKCTLEAVPEWRCTLCWCTGGLRRPSRRRPATAKWCSSRSALMRT